MASSKLVTFFGGPLDGEQISDGGMGMYLIKVKNAPPDAVMVHVYVWASRFNRIGYHYNGIQTEKV